MDHQKTNLASKAQYNEGIVYSRLTSLVNSMADGVIAVDKNIDIVLFNGAALNILDLNNLKEGDLIILNPPSFSGPFGG